VVKKRVSKFYESTQSGSNEVRVASMERWEEQDEETEERNREELTRTDPSRRRRFFERNRLRHLPYETRLRLDVLSERTFSLPRSAVNERSDAVSDLEVLDAVSKLLHDTGEVAAEPGVRRGDKIAVYEWEGMC
jgi:hypothetical protein